MNTKYSAGTCIKMLLCMLIFLASFFAFENTKAAAATDIRVGLKSLYMGKGIITIYNSDIKMGYCLNDSFKADIELKSAGGFSFEPDNSTYYTNGNDFESYSKALAQISSGTEGKVCYCGRNKWRVYYRSSKAQSGASKVSSTELIRMTFGKSELLIDGTVSSGYPQFSAAGGDKVISLGTRKYRGRMEIGRYGSENLTAVNIVNIESYLLSVVSCEMSTTWHSEAQKAQAICARSYCLANAGFKADSYLKKGYSIVDTDESQVYAGVGKESDMSAYAVKATMKMILKSNGKVLPAYYFSTSGGATEFATDVWGGTNSSFVGVFDEYETVPETAPWIKKTTYAELEEKLRAKGYDVSGITDIYPELLSDSGRVSSVRIKYKGGSVSVKGSVLKTMYGMRSTKYKIITSESNDFDVVVRTKDSEETVDNSEIQVISGNGEISSIVDNANQMVVISGENMTNFPLSQPDENEIWFIGMGGGHGIGMSQSGAYGMALKGFSYEQILNYYYRNIEITKY